MPASTPTGWAREVLAQRAAIVGACTAAVHVGVVLFALPPTLESSVPLAVGGGIDLLGLCLAVLVSRSAVTPLADPRDNAGRALVPAPGSPTPPATDSTVSTGTLTQPADGTTLQPPDSPAAG